MAELIIDLSGKGGLATRAFGDMDRTVGTPELRYIGESDQMADGIYNPLRRYGYMSPSNKTFAAITFSGGTHDAIMRSSLYDSFNDDFYFAENGEQIFKGDTLDDTELAQVLDLGSTGTPIIFDLEVYQLNGATKIFYVYEKSGKMEIGEADLPFASANNDWLTADVSGSFTNTLTTFAFMRVADNGFAYIFQDNKVHKLDGTTDGGANGTITPDVLLFPNNFQVTDAIDYRGRLYVAIRKDSRDVYTAETLSVQESEVGVYIWDRFTGVVRMRDFIVVTGIKEIRNLFVNPRGELMMVAVNSQRITELRKFDGSRFIVVAEAGVEGYPQYHDSLETIGQMTIWLAPSGNITAYGRVSINDRDGMFKLGKIQDTLISSGVKTGAILFGGANTDSTSSGFKPTKIGIYLSYRTSVPAFVMKEWDIYGTGADGVTAQTEVGNVYTLVKFLPQMSTINHIDLYMFPGDGSGSTTIGTVKIYFNQSTTAFASKTITRDESVLGYKRFEISKQYVNCIQLEVEFPDGDGLGTLDFAPSFAVVNYTLTETRG